MAPKVYVLILNWNNWPDTLECLESVFRLDYPTYQVIVCDNDSADGSLEKIGSWAAGGQTMVGRPPEPMVRFSQPPVKKPIPTVLHDRSSAETGGGSRDAAVPMILIQTGSNLGFAGGNNVGLRYSLARGDADFVWLLNNDTVIDPACLRRMVDHSLSRATANLCGSRVLYYHEPEIIQALGGAHYNKWTGLARAVGLNRPAKAPIDPEKFERHLSYILGASWLLPIRFLLDIGLMEESYFLYYEELDWCVRGYGRYTLTYADDARVYHKEGKSIGSSSDKRKTSLFSDFYAFRNQIDFTRKFFPEAMPTVYLTTFLQALNRVRRLQPDKARLIFRIMLGERKFRVPSALD